MQDSPSKKRLILIQAAVFASLLVCAEVGAWIFEGSFKKPAVELQLNMQPYMMFGANSGDGFTWLDIFTKEKVPSKIVFNNYGFSETFDYTMIPDAKYLQKHGKKPGEKIVLITGGSVVHGVGATGNDKTIAAQMQRYLNERSKGTHYRIINIGMGSWIAYQQFLGLSLFGLPLNPDWIVSMDGHNDAAVPCAHGSGAGNPLGWPKMLYMAQGGAAGEGNQTNPTLQTLANHSALVRIFSGLSVAKTENAVPRNLMFDDSDPDPRFRVKMAGLTVSEQDKQMEFYLQAQRNVMALFKHANIIMSSQPLMYNNAITPAFRTAFSPKGTPKDFVELDKALDEYIKTHASDVCRSDIASQLLGYFMARSATKLTDLAKAEQAADPSRHIIYENTEWAMPLAEELRKPYFVDNAHMSDKGQERIGEFFAEIILSAEEKKKFDFADFVKKHHE